MPILAAPRTASGLPQPTAGTRSAALQDARCCPAGEGAVALLQFWHGSFLMQHTPIKRCHFNGKVRCIIEDAYQDAVSSASYKQSASSRKPLNAHRRQAALAFLTCATLIT